MAFDGLGSDLGSHRAMGRGALRLNFSELDRAARMAAKRAKPKAERLGRHLASWIEGD